ncbi:MAG: ferredoxin family protein [Candidatus Bathyarchaeota archaeon]
MSIDQDFKKKRKVVGQHQGHDVWGPIEPPKTLGIHGSNVAVDWDICTGDGVCIGVCPVTLFEWGDAPRHQTSEKKSDPVREKDCIQCLAYELQCPVQAIKITT